MSLFKGTQAALFLSTATFALLAFPLAKFGDQAVDVRIDYQTEFSGSLRDISPPYLGAAALLSLSLGTAAFGLAGWKSSHQNCKGLRASIRSLENKVVQKDKLIQSLRLSERRLKSKGLTQFLQGGETQSPDSVKAQPQPQAKLYPATAETAKPQQILLKPVPAKPAHSASSKLRSAKAAPAAKLSSRVAGAVDADATHAFSVQAGHYAQPQRYGSEEAVVKTKTTVKAKQPVQQAVSFRV